MNTHHISLARHAAIEYGGWVKTIKQSHKPMPVPIVKCVLPVFYLHLKYSPLWGQTVGPKRECGSSQDKLVSNTQ